MANATNSTPGSVILAGDLTGTATSPALRPTGVTAGDHWPQKIWVDSKGRIIKCSSDISQNVSFDVASDTIRGIVKIYNGSYYPKFSFDNQISAPIATSSNFGVIRTDGLTTSVTNKVLSLTVPYTSSTQYGYAKIGNNISVTDGVINVDNVIATDTSLGLVKLGTYLSMSNSVINVQLIASKNLNNVFNKSQNSLLTTRDSISGDTYIAPTNNGDAQLLNLIGNLTIKNDTDSAILPGSVFTLIIKQDATGSRTVAFDSNYKTGGGITLSTAPDSYDILTFIVIDSSNIIVLFSPDWV